MLDWLKSLPKTMFVTVVLAAGVLFIVLSDPPRTVCDSQIKQFNTLTNDFLFLDPAKPNKKLSRYTRLIETCKTTNTAGGCFELFANIKKMLNDSHTVSPECFGKLSSHTEFSGVIWGTLDLLAQLAWGTAPPKTAIEKTGWFDSADLNLYCQLKKTAIDVYSQAQWDTFIGGYFTTLPSIQTLQRNDAWQKMLFSTNCSSYL